MPASAPILGVNWHELLIPSMGLLELVIRGSVMYLGIFFLMRLFRRNQGSINTADLLVLVVIADAAQNGMAAKYNSLTEGIVLVSTICGWNYMIDWLDFHFPAMHRLLEGAALPLVVHGRIHRVNLRGQLMTEDDLMTQLREHGVETLAEVKRCCLESDGHISVIKVS